MWEHLIVQVAWVSARKNAFLAGHSWNAFPLNELTVALWGHPFLQRKRCTECTEIVFLLNEWAGVAWEYSPLCRSSRTSCNYKAFFLDGFACGLLECQPLCKSNCTMNKRTVSLHCELTGGFPTWKSAAWIAALVAIVTFLHQCKICWILAGWPSWNYFAFWRVL